MRWRLESEKDWNGGVSGSVRGDSMCSCMWKFRCRDLTCTFAFRARATKEGCSVIAWSLSSNGNSHLLLRLSAHACCGVESIAVFNFQRREAKLRHLALRPLPLTNNSVFFLFLSISLNSTGTNTVPPVDISADGDLLPTSTVSASSCTYLLHSLRV